MKVLDFLLKVGEDVVKDIPMGNTILGFIDLLIPDDVDKDKITGNELLSYVELLSPELGAKIKDLEVLEDITDIVIGAVTTPQVEVNKPTTITYCAYAVAAIVTLLFSGIMAHAYFTAGVVPAIEALFVVCGMPAVAVMASLGVNFSGLLTTITDIVKRKK